MDETILEGIKLCLHTPKSGVVYGITDDAKHIEARIRDYLNND